MFTRKDNNIVEKKKINLSSSSSNLGYVPALDGLRSIAVMMVMFIHGHFILGYNGQIGVDIFFTLSGFLITTILLEELQIKGDFSLIRFYFKRTIRLLPALYIMLTLVLIYAFQLQADEKSLMIKELISSALYIHNFVYFWWNDYHNIIVGHTWTLAIEEQFYLIWPIFLYTFLKYFSLRWLKYLLIIVFSIFYTLHFFDIKNYSYLFSNSIILGCLTAIVRFSGHLKKIHPLILIATFVFLFALGFFPFSFFNLIAVSPRYLNEFVGFSTSILILGLVNSNSFINKLLSYKLPVYIGKISYSLYIFHAPVFFIFLKIYTIYHWPPSLVFALKFIVSFIVSILSWHFIEKRIINKGRIYLKNL